jgi:hypothetical protein
MVKGREFKIATEMICRKQNGKEAPEKKNRKLSNIEKNE